MASRLKTLADIPSLTTLYRTGKLKASKSEDLPNPNQKYNDIICTIQHNITKLEVDAIVNAANTRLLGGGGVDGAIHMAAGPGLLDECRTLGGCATGSAKMSGGHRLPCKKIIHAVGPIYENAEISEPLLRKCYKTALDLCIENDLKTIAFSGLSTGIYGYPPVHAAYAALREVRRFLTGPNGSKMDKIIFCSFSDTDVAAYDEMLPGIFPPTKEDVAGSSTSGEHTTKSSTPGDMPTSPSSKNPQFPNKVTSEEGVTQTPPSPPPTHKSDPTSDHGETSSTLQPSPTKKRKIAGDQDGARRESEDFEDANWVVGDGPVSNENDAHKDGAGREEINDEEIQKRGASAEVRIEPEGNDELAVVKIEERAGCREPKMRGGGEIERDVKMFGAEEHEHNFGLWTQPTTGQHICNNCGHIHRPGEVKPQGLRRLNSTEEWFRTDPDATDEDKKSDLVMENEET